MPSPFLISIFHSLAEYFVKHLPDHLTPVGEHPDLLPSLQLLLHPPSKPIATKFGGLLLGRCKSDSWYAVTSSMNPWIEWENPIDEPIAHDPATNLHLAIQLQLPQVCQSLLARNVQLDLARPIYSYHWPAVGHPPLVEAVCYGELEII